jgi:hypothetical protein
MCSNHGDDGPAAFGHAPTIVKELGDVLDRLLAADLSGLTGDERAALVAATVRAESRLRAGVLDAIAAFDTADVAATTQYRTTKPWLEHRARMSPGTAAHLARSARALRDHLPATRRALGRGSITPQHTSAIVEVLRKLGVDHATTAEPILLPLAQQVEPSVVRRAAAEIFSRVDPEGAEKALHDAYDRRGVSLSISGPPGSERGYLDGVLDVESTELLLAALQPLMSTSGPDDPRSTRQLRADALVDIAKLALDSGVEPDLGKERPHLSVVIDEQALLSGIGTATLPWTGAAVPAGAVRRWACDAQVTPVLARLLPPPLNGRSQPASSSAIQLGGGWLPMDVGRASRLATTGQIKALRVRDGGCVHPDCSRTATYCDAHHVQHWADGGPTSLDNLVLLCRHHHRTLHHGMWSLRPDGGHPGRFWATSAGWDRPAQATADRSPVVASVDRPPGSPPSMHRPGLQDEPAWRPDPPPRETLTGHDVWPDRGRPPQPTGVG